MQVVTHLQQIRRARGLSAAELANRVGVRRQTIYDIEDGSYIPNTAISLQLCRVLGVTVEEVFSLPDEGGPEPVSDELLARDQMSVGQLARLCRVGERLIAIPVSAQFSYLPAADGVIAAQRNRQVSVQASLPEDGKRLLVAGCDPALSLLSDLLQPSGIEIINVSCSSRSALQRLKAGKVHAAGSHLLDRSTGQYNLPIVQRYLPREALRMVTFAAWEQGLITRQGNPKSIRSIADLSSPGITLINREKGSGTRDLLDAELGRLGIPTHSIAGYDTFVEGHLAAAHAVFAGSADCCIAPRSAARCFGLNFIPLTVERFDLTFSGSSLALPAAKAVLDSLSRSQFRNKLQSIAGYDTSHTGETLV